MARPRWGGGSGASPGFTTDGHLRLPAHPVPASPPRRPRFLQRPARAVGAQPEVSCSRRGCDPAPPSRLAICYIHAHRAAGGSRRRRARRDALHDGGVSTPTLPLGYTPRTCPPRPARCTPRRQWWTCRCFLTTRRSVPVGEAEAADVRGAGGEGSEEAGEGVLTERRRHTTAQPWRSSAARRWRNEKKMNRERGRRRIEKERLTSGTMGKLIFNQSFSLHFDRK
ncbi:Os05g0425650 [Oryza sativa Japonica Group]|uniref:Os05g0425650 protein n=1 Tax=Oryza sativa subsp. japonica TaxID=39947 RepID=A0A0P0WMM4_ORYSJ|nr:Os05g0425650 [Oryza sativa Japonica Group]